MSPEGGNASTIHTCDICPRVVFESDTALERHINLRHKSMMESINAFLEKDVTEFDFQMDADKVEALGKKAFEVASKRDAGPRMLQCASTAREQLQHIVDEWSPGAEVFIFGSSLVMSSWDGKSDIDFAVVDPKAYIEKRWPPEERHAVRELTDLCKAAGFRVSSLECVDTARVPIVKHKTLQQSLSGVIEQSAEESKSRRSIRVQFQSEKIRSTKDLRQWLQTQVDPCSIEQIEPSEHGSAAITFVSSTKALVAMLRINSRQKRRMNELITAQQVDEQLPPESHCIDFDLCLRQFGIRNSEYLRKFHTLHENSPYLRCGAVVLKEWSKLWGLNNSFMGFLTSYAINIMWIYFLVQRNVIPYVSPYDTPEDPKDALRKPTYVPILPEHAQIPETRNKMGTLLADFFKFYSTEFDWSKNVVTLNRPGVTQKKSIGWIPENEIKLSRQSKNVRYIICIEDPYEPNLNLGRHLGVCKARKIRAEFRRAAMSLKSDSMEDCILFNSQYKQQVYVPMKDPPQEIFKAVQHAVLKIFDEEKTIIYTPDSLRATLTERVPDSFGTILTYWSWKVLVRRLGLRQVGDQIKKRASFGFLSEGTRGKPMGKAALTAQPSLNVQTDTAAPQVIKTSHSFSISTTCMPCVMQSGSLQLRKLVNTFRLFRL